MGILFFIFLCAIPIYWAIAAKDWPKAIFFTIITIVFLAANI